MREYTRLALAPQVLIKKKLVPLFPKPTSKELAQPITPESAYDYDNSGGERRQPQ